LSEERFVKKFPIGTSIAEMRRAIDILQDTLVATISNAERLRSEYQSYSRVCDHRLDKAETSIYELSVELHKFIETSRESMSVLLKTVEKELAEDTSDEFRKKAIAESEQYDSEVKRYYGTPEMEKHDG